MSETRTQRNVVLLNHVPSGVGDVLELFFPGLDEQTPLPPDELTVDVNGHELTFAVGRQPLREQGLDRALSISPMQRMLADAVARHAAYVSVTFTGPDLLAAQATMTVITATVADSLEGVAVYLPDVEQLTTDVLYTGEAERNPTLTWFNTMAARVDERTAIAHTIGLARLVGTEVQLRTSALDPGAAFRGLREGVAAALDAGAPLVPQASLVIEGVPHLLTPGTSQIGYGQVLDAVPGQAQASPQAAPKEEGRRRGWFGRR